MSVKIQFFTFVIPLTNIEKYYPGGLVTFRKEQKGLYPEYDDYLYKTSVMNAMDLDDVVQFWESLGAIAIVEENGVKMWKDFCIVEVIERSAYPCDWLVFCRHKVCHVDDNTGI
jgi:hypothetical protein